MSWALAPLSWAFGLLSCRWRQGRAWRWGSLFSQAFWPVKKSTLISWKPCCWWVPEGGCCSKTGLGIGEEGNPYRTDTPVLHCSQLDIWELGQSLPRFHDCERQGKTHRCGRTSTLINSDDCDFIWWTDTVLCTVDTLLLPQHCTLGSVCQSIKLRLLRHPWSKSFLFPRKGDH